MSAAAPAREWFADESFWRDWYPWMFPEDRFAAAAEQVDRIVELTGIGSGDVLDLCCGPGRHSIALTRRGFTVVGVDRTEFLLDKARQRAADEGADVEWVSSDMRDFVRPSSFDLAINMFTSFGYFEHEEDDLRVLRNIHESLRPGGRFLIDVISKEYLARVFQPTSAYEDERGNMFVQRHEIVDGWTRIRNRWVLVTGDRARSFSFEHAVYSGGELKVRLLEAGFADVAIYGGLDGRAYDNDVQRLVAVASKTS